jgi:hypothetical protein
MFIEITRRLSQAPEERHMPYVAPPELGELLRNVFYKHYAPLALQNLGIRQHYQSCGRPGFGFEFFSYTLKSVIQSDSFFNNGLWPTGS